MATIDTSWKPVAVPDLGGQAFLGYSSQLRQNATNLFDNMMRQRQADAKLAYDKENDALNRALKENEIASGLYAKQYEIEANREMKEKEFANALEVARLKAKNGDGRTLAALISANTQRQLAAEKIAHEDARAEYAKSEKIVNDFNTPTGLANQLTQTRAYREMSPATQKILSDVLPFLHPNDVSALVGSANSASQHVFGITVDSFENKVKEMIKNKAIDIAARSGTYYANLERLNNGVGLTALQGQERVRAHQAKRISDTYRGLSTPEEKQQAKLLYPQYANIFEAVDKENTTTSTQTNTGSTDPVRTALQPQGQGTVRLSNGQTATSFTAIGSHLNKGGK